MREVGQKIRGIKKQKAYILIKYSKKNTIIGFFLHLLSRLFPLPDLALFNDIVLNLLATQDISLSPEVATCKDKKINNFIAARITICNDRAEFDGITEEVEKEEAIELDGFGCIGGLFSTDAEEVEKEVVFAADCPSSMFNAKADSISSSKVQNICTRESNV